MSVRDLAVRRPVATIVLALLIAIFGAVSFNLLTTREYPDVSPPVVSVSTIYIGASADIVESRITRAIEGEISGIEGIRSIRSSSVDGRSNINVEFFPSRDIDAAANDVRDKVSRAVRQLPSDAEAPIVAKSDSDASPLIYISLEGGDMPLTELTDYAQRYMVDRFSVLPGVAMVSVHGSGSRSVRIWLDRLQLVARSLTASDVIAALRNETLELPAGLLESPEMEFPLRLQRNFETEDDFRQLIIGRGADGHLITLGEVARVESGSENSRRLFITNGRESMALGIVKQSDANTLEVLEAVRSEIAEVRASLPPGMAISASGDVSHFIRSAINGVYLSLILTTLLVATVIYIFLGTIRATLSPILCVPLALLGSCTALLSFGYSLNLITLLAMVMSIGLVVDDAIVVLENIYRRIENGDPPLLAAIRGAGQVGFAVVATTTVLLAVFTPIFFLQNNMGRIFAELAVTLCVAVVISSLMALTLVPMLCSKLAKEGSNTSRMKRLVERVLSVVANRYLSSLRWFLKHNLWLAPLLIVLVVCSGYRLAQLVESEYAPVEDQDTLFLLATAQEGLGVDSMRRVIEELQQPLMPYIAGGDVTRALFVAPRNNNPAPSIAYARISLTPSTEREFSVFELRDEMTGRWNQIPGLRISTFMPSGLGGQSSSSPVEFVLQGTDYTELANWRDRMINAATRSGLFLSIKSDLRENQPQMRVSADLSRAAALGVSAQEIAVALQIMMSEQEASTFIADGEEYPVIVQLEKDQRGSPDDIANIFVRADTGQLVQLANLVSLESTVGMGDYQRYNRMRAVTISGTPAPGVSLGKALEFLEQTVEAELPASVRTAYRGQSLQYKESSAGIFLTFTIALLVVYLVMGAQFESLIHPLVIMVTVPLAIVGGLLGLVVTGHTLSIFSQVGLLMLVGIATKNGILLVEFINQQRDAGQEFQTAIVEACAVRLRPVLMTTVSTLAGTIPLIAMVGPGSASRNVLGIVIFFGVAVSSILTLYLVPGLYYILARGTSSPQIVDRRIAALQAEEE